MRFPSATLHTVLRMGLTATPLLCVSPAAAQDVAASAVAGLPSPRLFWISRDDVAGARITRRGARARASAYQPLIGSTTYDLSHEER